MADTLGISSSFPVELYALIEQYAIDHGYTDKNGPVRGTAVTVIVADALNFPMPKPASAKETPEQKKARETLAAKVKTAEAKVKLANLTGRGLEEATKALAEAQANLANGNTPASTPTDAPAEAPAGRAK